MHYENIFKYHFVIYLGYNPTHDLKLNGAFMSQERKNIFYPSSHSFFTGTSENPSLMTLKQKQRLLICQYYANEKRQVEACNIIQYGSKEGFSSHILPTLVVKLHAEISARWKRREITNMSISGSTEPAYDSVSAISNMLTLSYTLL